MSELITAVLRASVHRLIGRLGGDPELKYFQSGNSVATARIAVNRPGAKKDDGQEPDWFKVEIWGEQGQAFTDACRKGQMVDVTGRIKIEQWTDRSTGKPRTQLVITADEWKLAGTAVTAAPAAVTPAPAAAAPATTLDWTSSWSGTQEEVPF